MASQLPPKPKIDLSQYLNTDGSLKSKTLGKPARPARPPPLPERPLSSPTFTPTYDTSKYDTPRYDTSTHTPHTGQAREHEHGHTGQVRERGHTGQSREHGHTPRKSPGPKPGRGFKPVSERLADEPRESSVEYDSSPSKVASILASQVYQASPPRAEFSSGSPNRHVPMGSLLRSPVRSPVRSDARSDVRPDVPPRPRTSSSASASSVSLSTGASYGSPPSNVPGTHSRMGSVSSMQSSTSLSPTRNYAPKPTASGVPLQTHLADHKPPAVVPTAFLSSKTRRILAANDRYVCVDTASKTLLYSWRSSALVWRLKSPALCATFVPETSTLWLGTVAGRIIVVDVTNGQSIQVLERGHMKPVTYIATTGYGIVSLSADDGKLNVWSARNSGSPFKVCRIRAGVSGRSSFISTGSHSSEYLWMCKDRQVEVYQPANQMLPLVSATLPGRGANLGSITSIAAYGDMCFLGQNDGFITIFKGTQQLGIVNGGIHSITALAAPSGTELWVGTRSGEILIFALRLSFVSTDETMQLSATLLRQWKAHATAINDIMLAESKAAILSTDRNHAVLAWNSTPVDVLPASPSNTEGFKVHVLTWNVGACAPETIPSDWIVSPEAASADIVVIGLQEVVELESTSQHALNIVRPTDQESDKDHARWQQFLDMLLIPYGFTQIASKSMVGIMTCVFVKTSVAKYTSNLRADVVKTGIGGTYGNKGAVLLSLELGGMSWCFVNCHLAAGHTAIMQRNRDASQIMTNERFQSDVCFFLGDTNYRINAAREQAEQLIKDENWDQLRRQDQLSSQIMKNPSFCLSRFQEGELSFPPTYKYDRGTNFYDTSDKKRIPSWCDRILFRGKSIVAQNYDAVEKTTTSDHKAVIGTYFVPRLV